MYLPSTIPDAPGIGTEGVPVFRPERDEKYGNIIGEVADYPIGTLTGVIIGGPSPEPVPRFPGTISTEGLIGVPFRQDSAILLEVGDYLALGGTAYKVTGPRQWTRANTLTGTRPTHYWCECTANF